MDNINQIMADKLIYYRKEHRMTQEELAEHLGVTFQAVSKWETARSAPDITFLPLLADLFGCSIDELFGRTHDAATVISHDLPWDNNNKIYHAALFKGHELISDGEALRKFTFIIDAEIEHLTVHGNAEIHGSVTEGCSVGNNLKITGTIVGDCQIGNNGTCDGNITGTCSAGNNLEVKGGIVGDTIHAGNNLTVWHGDITGDCAAGNNIEVHDDITGDCAAQGNITAKEICAENLSSNGTITVSGNATIKGEAHCHTLKCGSISEGKVIILQE